MRAFEAKRPPVEKMFPARTQEAHIAWKDLNKSSDHWSYD